MKGLKVLSLSLFVSFLVAFGSSARAEIPLHIVCEESQEGGGLPSLGGEENVSCQVAAPNATASCTNSEGNPLTTEETMAMFPLILLQAKAGGVFQSFCSLFYSSFPLILLQAKAGGSRGLLVFTRC